MKKQNPYAYLRTRCGMTQRGFAEYADLARSTLVYIEAGLYPDISDRQNMELARLCHEKGIDARAELLEHYGHTGLNTSYKAWQSAERNRLSKGRLPEPRWSERGPFRAFVEDTAKTVDRFCKMLKVPPATVTRYLEGQTATMPLAIASALSDVDYLHTKRLTEYQDKWVELQN